MTQLLAVSYTLPGCHCDIDVPGAKLLGGRTAGPDKVSGSDNGAGMGAGIGMAEAATLVLSSNLAPWQQLVLVCCLQKWKVLLKCQQWLQKP